MATGPIRAETAAYIATHLATAVAPVSVDEGWPRSIERLHAWVSDIHGASRPPVSMGGRIQRQDEFLIEWQFWSATPGQTQHEAKSAVQAMYAALDNLLAADPGLGGLDGLLDCWLADSSGPSADPTDEGYVAAMTAQVFCRSRLH